MTPERVQQLSAALRAQAAGLVTEAPAGPAFRDAEPEPGRPSPGPRAAQRGPRGLPAWAVLALAVLLGALAGGLAGAISAW
ncbi:MAG: hypothetical protein ACRDSL_13930 [Pseudonocardiaceae bacterium]